MSREITSRSTFDEREGPCERLVALAQRLAPAKSATLCEGQLALAKLGQTLSRLPASSRESCDPVLAGVAEHLQDLLRDVNEQVELDEQTSRDLAVLLRRAQCVVDHVATLPAEVRPAMEDLTVRYSPVDLASFVRELGGAFTALARERRIRYELRVPECLVAHVDADKLSVAFLNLLFNAFKFTPRGGCVECFLEASEPGEVVFRVADSGPGVPPAHAGRIFDRSRQIDRSVFLSAAGIGFSLGMSRDFVTLHGGSLTLDGSHRIGTAFEVRLPRIAPRGSSLSASATRPGAMAARVAGIATRELRSEASLARRAVDRDGRPLVLIVEDSRAIQRIVTDCLAPEYATASAFDGQSGLERAVELRPDLVVLDLGLPQMDGETLMRRIRDRPEMEEIQVLFLTGSDDPERIVRLLESGAQDVIRKPFLLPELRARVGNLVSAKRTRDVLNDSLGQHETDMVKLARDVAAKQEELECALTELDKERRHAEALNLIKSNFLRMMSHELKTPIAAMQLHIRVLERDPDANMSARLQDGMTRISRSSRRLLNLVNTMLFWARVESGRYKLLPQTFDLGTLVAEVTEEMADHAEQKGIRLSVRAPDVPLASLSSDRGLVRLLLLNLIGRAVQVTEEGAVEIALEMEMESDCQSVAIRDGGPPIAHKREAEIFDPLPSVKDLHRSSGSGSGLDLHVVRDLAWAVQGDVVLEPAPKGGNVFALKLPACRTEQAVPLYTAEVVKEAIRDDQGRLAADETR